MRSKIFKSDKVLSKILKFFTSRVGLAIVVASSSIVGYGIIKLIEKEEEASPFKK